MGWAMICFALTNVLVNLILAGRSSIMLSYRDYVKKHHIKKSRQFVQKMLDNRQQLSEQYPERFPNFEIYFELQKAAEFSKDWFVHKKWLVANKISFEEFNEENMFKQLVKKFDLLNRANKEHLESAIVKAALVKTEIKHDQFILDEKMEQMDLNDQKAKDNYEEIKSKEAPAMVKKTGWSGIA